MTFAETLIDRFTRDYPGYLGQFSTSDSWLAAAKKSAAYARDRNYSQADFDRLVDNCALGCCLVSWREHRPVYSIDTTLAESFWEQAMDTADTDELPADLLLNPPYPAIEINTPVVRGIDDGDFTGRVLVSCDEMDGTRMLVTFWEHPMEEPVIRYLPILPGHPIGDCREKLLSDFLESVPGATMEDVLAESLAVLFVAQVVLYIQSQKPDIQSRPTSRKKTPGQPKPPRLYDVGLRIGQTIRSAAAERAESAEPVNRAYPESRRSPIPHTRRGHWHRFRTGKRGDPSTWKYTIQWIPPLFVGGKHDPTTTIIKMK